MKILTEASALALWKEALTQAQSESHIILDTEVEAYLSFMLLRYTNCRELAKEIMATSFLQGIQEQNKLREVHLQTVGDKCLLISGLFPAVAEKRRLKVAYYIEIGQIAYDIISHGRNDIFSSLSQQFVPLMDVLQAFRPETLAPLPPEIRHLWEKGK